MPVNDLVVSFLFLILFLLYLDRACKNSSLFALLFAGLVSRSVYAFLLWSVGLPLYIESDAVDFIATAANESDPGYGYGATFYISAISWVFDLIGYCPVFISVLSSVAWSLSVLNIVTIWGSWCERSPSMTPLIVVSALPFQWIVIATPMREAWQALSLVLVIRAVSDMMKCGVTFRCLFVLGIGCGLATVFHQALFISVVLLPLICLVVARYGPGKTAVSVYLSICFMVLISTDVYFHGLFIDLITREQLNRQIGAGSLDYVIAPPGNYWNIAPFVIASFYRVAVGPLLWEVNSILFVYIAMEGVIKVWLYWRCRTLIYNNHVVIGSHYNLAMIIILFVMTVLGVWGLGTANYGTAIRHSGVVLPLLVLVVGLLELKVPVRLMLLNARVSFKPPNAKIV